MIKHIIGFALFVFIVTCGVMVYAFLYTPPMPQIEKVRIPVAVAEPSRGKTEVSPLSYELKSFTVDLEKRQATIEVRLEWNSAEKPPHGLMLDFGVTTADRPFARIHLVSKLINRPFGSSRSIGKTFVLDLKEISGMSPQETAYYGNMEATDIAELTPPLSPAVYVEKNRMIGAIPALVRHPLKK